MKVVVYTGMAGRPVALDVSKVEAVLDEGSGETHIFTSSDWYKVRASFESVLADWRQDEAPK